MGRLDRSSRPALQARIKEARAALLFCVAVGAFATSSIVFIKELGVGTALAVLIDATIVRAPQPLRRLYDRVGSREGAPA